MPNPMRMKRAAVILGIVGAVAAGLTDSLPFGRGVAALLGVGGAQAQQTEACPNTDCEGTADCSYLVGFRCRVDKGKNTCTNQGCS